MRFAFFHDMSKMDVVCLIRFAVLTCSLFAVYVKCQRLIGNSKTHQTSCAVELDNCKRKLLTTAGEEGFLYMGCYVDTKPNRTLTGFQTLQDFNMTVRYCIQLCKERNFLFSGLQYTFQCFCGNNPPKVRAPERECNHRCKANPSEICGGSLRLSLYVMP